ncbi:hypothetical protein JCM10207_005932 [Rhodosporidiobolus poonsookiae]
MVVARASTEPPGEGIIGAVADDVKQQVDGAESVAVDYPATLSNYFASEAEGVDEMTKLVEASAKNCPNSKIALLGYSQGAQVAGDTLCGLSAQAQGKVVAMIQMGDPTFNPGKEFDVGSSNKPGIFANQQADCLDDNAAIIQSFCDNGDTFCASGASLATHLGYVREFGTEATDFVVQKAA